jgi:uracil phosphoribosyltransferase
VPILRAGLVLVEQAASVLPANQTFHLGKSHMLCNGSRFSYVKFFKDLLDHDVNVRKALMLKDLSSSS